MKKCLNANGLKVIAMAAMTADHFASVIWPGYGRDWWLLLIHALGRLAAPIFWYFIAEGYHHTRSWKRYASRLLAFAVVSHFAYNFAFGIPFIPFQATVFNQTSVIWPLFWGLAALAMFDCKRLRQWQKWLLLAGICVITFPADWSCIAVMAILHIGQNRGNFRNQMTGMMIWVSFYALVYVLFIDPVYGFLQLLTCMTIPLLGMYNGEKGRWVPMKWVFYLYYPLHLVLCGLLRLALHGSIGVLIGS